MAVISNGMVMGEVVRGPFSRELVKHPLGVGGSAFSFVSQWWESCAALDSLEKLETHNGLKNVTLTCAREYS